MKNMMNPEESYTAADYVRTLCKQGAMTNAETERIAVETLADLMGTTLAVAEAIWIIHTKPELPC